MIKEETRFESSTIFEGMTSIRALVDNLKSGNEDARIINEIWFDKTKEKSKARDISYLKRMGEQFSFKVIPVSKESIEQHAIGASHGGIIAFCQEKAYSSLADQSGNNLAHVLHRRKL